MEKTIKDYLYSKEKLLNNFDCDTDYFVKNLDEYNWRVKDMDGMFFLTYWKEGGKLNECVIVKKNNNPLIMRKEDYTMIVIIECVKIAVVLKNDMEV
ncbi:MAG: hypothetical protein HFE59_01460 [Clostridiales bacterium]|nr:hypothetical protein [Clostridiales bacterium]